tara:strand:- start:2467 stop:3597 length:1131 start_codon:yes stop_codon:yes gene_type:complete
MSALGDLVYAQVEPEAKASTYGEFDTLDFVINVGEGRALVKNSIRLLGTLRINSTGTTRATGDVRLNHNIGVHACIDSAQITFNDGAKAGIVENIQNYGRYVRMIETGTEDINDLMNGSNLMELKAPSANLGEALQLAKTTVNATGANITTDQDFALAPVIALNKMDGGNVPFSATGSIRVSINLAKNLSALEGGLAGSAVNWNWSDVRLAFNHVSDRANPQPAIMRTVYNFKSSVLSSTANISARVPAVADSVSISFQRQDRENVNVLSNYGLEEPRNVKSLQYMFNDSTNQYISYVIEDKNEMLEKGVESLVATGHNGVFNAGRLQRNNNFLAGLNFNGFVDLSNQRFNVQLVSDIDTNNPYNIYMYFHSLLRL